MDFEVRSPKQFYEDQIEFKKKIEERINLKKDQIRLEEAMKMELEKQKMKIRRQKSQEMALLFKQRALNKDFLLSSTCKDLSDDALFKL